MNDFDPIARFYDFLARLIYGESIRKAQIIFLKRIKSGSKVLVMGGGTGWIVKAIFKAQPDCEVYYVEASSKMIAMARRYQQNGSVHFTHGTEDNIPGSILFDVVITNFYLDMFSPPTLQTVISKIIKSLQPDSLWIITDFKDEGKLWQTFLLKMMYKFFRWACSIEANKLPDWSGLIIQNKFVQTDSQYFFSRFIEATIYSRGASV